MAVVRGLAFPIRFGPLGHLERAEGEDKLLGNLRVIVVTALRERFMSPNFGSIGYSMLFRHLNRTTVRVIEQVTRDAIAQHEPRVSVVQVNVNPEYVEGRLTLAIKYRLVHSTALSDTTVVLNEVT